MPDDASVIVVGAGPAGLSTAGALGRVGIRTTVLERDSEVGARWAERYDRLRLHTIRRFSGLAHHPLPRELPRYVSKDEFARYLRDSARLTRTRERDLARPRFSALITGRPMARRAEAALDLVETI